MEERRTSVKFSDGTEMSCSALQGTLPGGHITLSFRRQGRDGKRMCSFTSDYPNGSPRGIWGYNANEVSALIGHSHKYAPQMLAQAKEDWSASRFMRRCSASAGEAMISLLTIEEAAEAFRNGEPWLTADAPWLLMPGSEQDIYVTSGGWLSDEPAFGEMLGIRPVLRVNSPGIHGCVSGGKFSLGGAEWTVISPTAALCDKTVTERPYQSRNENSQFMVNIGRFLESWAIAHGISINGKTVT